MNNFIPEGVGAFATAVLFRMVLPIDLPDPELYALILHELTHIFQYHILFPGSLGKSLTASPPQWFMEGMASYYGEDETAHDRMFLRDAVVNDLLPPITEAQGGGFFAYRFGHAAFDFIEERWGKDGLRDFLYEFRNTLGARVDRAVERAFRIDPEDFDAEFRRWLRQKYLPQLVETGEPSDFGRPFRTDATARQRQQELSPTASPSGDLVAAFSTVKNDVDVVLFDAQKRRLLRNLTKGCSTKYQYLLAQNLTLGRRMGRDIAFSPDGNSLAVFARARGGARAGDRRRPQRRRQRVIDMAVEQQMTPAWSPDGKHIAFSGNTEGIFDLFLLDLETLEIQNVTKDADLRRRAGLLAGRQLAGLQLGGRRLRPALRGRPRPPASGGAWRAARRTTTTRSSRATAAASTSPRTATAASTTSTAWTSPAARCASTPTRSPAASCPPCCRSRTAATSWSTPATGTRRFDLYLADLETPIGEVQQAAIVEPGPVSRRGPAGLRARHPGHASTRPTRRRRRASSSSSRTPAAASASTTTRPSSARSTSRSATSSAIAGCSASSRRSTASRTSTSTTPTCRAATSARSRCSTSATSSSPTSSIRSPVCSSAATRRSARPVLLAGLTRPFSFYRRGNVSVGYFDRKIDFTSYAEVDIETSIRTDPSVIIVDGQAFVPGPVPARGQLPDHPGRAGGRYDGVGLWGPQRGHRMRLFADYAPNIDKDDGEESTLEIRAFLDFREYLPTTQRSGFAFRVFAGYSDGDFPQPFYFGGFDTVRGFEFRELVGDRAFYGNIEWRFPLIDLLATPVLASRASAGASSSTSAEPGSTRSRTSTSTTRTRAGWRTRCRRTAWASPSGSSG